MIPCYLRLSGFLSYDQPVELDFTVFDLACISGPNGAGKSTLLDAITWALFGQARRRDDALINNHAKAAEVIFDFNYEGSLYRIQRTKPREKPTVLEFYLRDPESGCSHGQRCLELYPDREQLYEMIYESRFQRLWEQFRGEPEEHFFQGLQ